MEKLKYIKSGINAFMDKHSAKVGIAGGIVATVGCIALGYPELATVPAFITGEIVGDVSRQKEVDRLQEKLDESNAALDNFSKAMYASGSYDI